MSEHITPDSLTEREIEVLRGVSTGTGNRGIAAQLGLSEETVRGHLKIVFQKLRANDRTHAVVIAAKRGFLTI
jgi:DNA-binding NarL/FixJ family response regulator